ncbi:cyclase family protein [Actinacidiphila sp. ITFR-21]|uniref:cyclase family protein n=1 Tax=Actinacidiphila sp. ITFR-21 TaxID=3075199 RepID=UPI00288B26BC|nr:cyclase family protein [Streptomyces sp. ITFR-21]WNI19006.1 cyclase family protein [Streptomyces sp. ITFR-21]
MTPSASASASPASGPAGPEPAPPAPAPPGTARPPFDRLPRLPGSGLPHAWDVYGPDDESGTVNLLDGPTVAAALARPRSGRRIALSLPVTLPDPPLFKRRPVRHEVFPTGRNTWDDRLDGLYLQASSQWDSLRHVRAREDGFYGGWQGDPDQHPTRLGIQNWASGIVGRGVLVDIAAELADEPGYDPFDRFRIETDHLKAALARQGTELVPGDILCLRTGWMDRYLAMDTDDRTAHARLYEDVDSRRWAGLSGGEDMSRYLWDSGVSAVVADNPAVEYSPGEPWLGSLHRRLIPCLGFALGELFTLGELAAACRAAGAYDFLFVAVPLNLPGGVGSPANAMAVV